MKSSTYIDQLYIEYNQAIKDKKICGFKEWLELKKIALNEYYKAMVQLGYNQNTPIIELGKGNFDSIAIAMKEPKNLTEISNHISIIYSNNINKIKGQLIINDGYLKIQNGNIKKPFDLRNQQYTIQLPIDEDTLQLAKYLMLINEKVYLGACGNMNDGDFDKKNEIIYTLYYQMTSCGVEMDNNIIDNKDIYALIVTNKIKTYKK